MQSIPQYSNAIPEGMIESQYHRSYQTLKYDNAQQLGSQLTNIDLGVRVFPYSDCNSPKSQVLICASVVRP